MKRLEEELLDFLRDRVATAKQPGRAGTFYCCIEDFVLQNGEFFEAQPLPSTYLRGEATKCFVNATELALEHTDLRYVEGFASTARPEHHAWCVDVAGRVIDNSPPCPPQGTYFGVWFPTPFLRLGYLRAEHYGVFDNDELEAELLRVPFDRDTLDGLD